MVFYQNLKDSSVFYQTFGICEQIITPLVLSRFCYIWKIRELYEFSEIVREKNKQFRSNFNGECFSV